MNITISLDELNNIFDKAESETAFEFGMHTCSMRDRHGKDTCPICFFRQQVKRQLVEREYQQVNA